jgi:hypothetical protein
VVLRVLCANGPVESVACRATLFGRLLDENGRRLAPGRTVPEAEKVGMKEGKK